VGCIYHVPRCEPLLEGLGGPPSSTSMVATGTQGDAHRGARGGNPSRAKKYLQLLLAQFLINLI
jgi:hypothetical protein